MLDEAFIYIVKDLIARAWQLGHQAPFTPQPFPESPIKMDRVVDTTFRRLIVNSRMNSEKGVHWFNVAYGRP
jgi:hypothetical protein